MLRIVHPAREGQGTRPPKGRRSAALSLTAEEAQHFRAALREEGFWEGDLDGLICNGFLEFEWCPMGWRAVPPGQVLQ